MNEFDFTKHTPGALGALSAMFFLKGSWPMRIAMVVPGAIFAYFAGPALSGLLHMNESLAGYLAGLFGVAAIGKVFATWDALDLGTLLRKAIAQLLRIKEDNS